MITSLSGKRIGKPKKQRGEGKKREGEGEREGEFLKNEYLIF